MGRRGAAMSDSSPAGGSCTPTGSSAILALSAFFWTYWLAGWRPGLPMAGAGALYRRATTMTLAGIVAAQVGNGFACRAERASIFRIGFTSNPLLLVGVAVEIAAMVALIAIPPLRHVFDLEPLGFHEWGVLVMFPPLMLLAEEARKLVLRRWWPHELTAPAAPPDDQV